MEVLRFIINDEPLRKDYFDLRADGCEVSIQRDTFPVPFTCLVQTLMNYEHHMKPSNAVDQYRASLSRSLSSRPFNGTIFFCRGCCRPGTCIHTCLVTVTALLSHA